MIPKKPFSAICLCQSRFAQPLPLAHGWDQNSLAASLPARHASLAHLPGLHGVRGRGTLDSQMGAQFSFAAGIHIRLQSATAEPVQIDYQHDP
jgi:hypothetical protein